jgi:hypothetical protein
MVNIPVNDHHPLESKLIQRNPGRKGRVVEQTESLAMIGKSVVAGRTNEGVRALDVAAQNRPGRRNRRAHREGGHIERLLDRVGVGANHPAAVDAKPVKLIDVVAVVNLGEGVL